MSCSVGMNTTEIQLFDRNDKPVGLGRIWEARQGKWSWAHPNGSEGVNCASFEEAETELDSATE